MRKNITNKKKEKRKKKKEKRKKKKEKRKKKKEKRKNLSLAQPSWQHHPFGFLFASPTFVGVGPSCCCWHWRTLCNFVQRLKKEREKIGGNEGSNLFSFSGKGFFGSLSKVFLYSEITLKKEKRKNSERAKK